MYKPKHIKLFENYLFELKQVNPNDVNNLFSTYFILHKGHFYFFDYSDNNFISKFLKFAEDNNLPILEKDFDSVCDYIEKNFSDKREYIVGTFFEKNNNVILDIFYNEFNDVKYSDEVKKILTHFNNLDYVRIDDKVYTRDEILSFKFNNDFKLGEYVYHGTSLENLKNILKYGLKPKSGKSFFKDMSDDLVHITTSLRVAKTYAIINTSKDFNLKNVPIVIEIRTDKLNKNLIDYDYKFYNKNVKDKNVNINKTSNLNKFGYKGIILPTIINRVCVGTGSSFSNLKWYNIDEIKNIINEIY